MGSSCYIMENQDETTRLELKTREEHLRQQALWAGLQPGHRVADIGCGPGLTSSYLHHLVQPSGEVVGIDTSPERINHARERYGADRLRFVQHDFLTPLTGVGEFDFVWMRFVLEYYRKESFEIVRNLTTILKPGGILCLIDLDHNCRCHYGLPPRLDKAMRGVIDTVERDQNFDPYAGRKLYAHLHDLQFEDIEASVLAHHLIYGEVNEVDEFNWRTKVEVAARNSGYDFSVDYRGGYEEFFEEFGAFFSNPRRFTYTPLICCKGRKPV